MTDGSKLVGVAALQEQEETAVAVRLFFVGFFRSLRGSVLPAALEPVAVAVHFQDVDVVGEPVQQGSGEAFRAEDLGPLVEGKVGGHHDRAPLVALAEDLEEQFRAGAGQGHEAQFVDDQQVEPGQLFLQVQQAPFVPGLHNLMHQAGGGGEAHRHPALAGGQSQPQGQVGLAGAAVADGDDVLPALDVFTACQLHHQRLVQRRYGREVRGCPVAFDGSRNRADAETAVFAPCAGVGR